MVVEGIDKFGLIITKYDYTYINKKHKYNPHIFRKKYFGGYKITATSKVAKEYNVLNDISRKNIDAYPEEIVKATGINIPLQILTSSPLYWLDIKADVQNDTGLTEKEVLSVLKEKAYKKTMKNLIIDYDKDNGFESSLVFKSSCKTVKDSLIIYIKIPEIISNRNDDPDYFSNFSEEFLEENANIIRFERRLQSAKDIKKAFHLEHMPFVTLDDIFDSQVNVVAEKVKELFM